jgi:hypothetical protein
LEGIEARAAARAKDFRGGTGALVMRSVRKQLDQGVKLYGIAGEDRPLGLSVFGNPNQVHQSFKATVQIADAQGVYVGNAVVNVVSEFFNMKAVDWSKLSKFPAYLRPCASQRPPDVQIGTASQR